MIKGKYYPNREFLTATKKRRSSETWRVMLYGCEAMKMGLIKRIGPGDKVNIWEDNWIASLESFKPTVRLDSARIERVEVLFVNKR